MIYEYQCDDCGTLFETQASLEEKERGLAVTCPACGSTRVTQVFTAVTVVTRSRAGGAPHGRGPGRGGACCS